MPGVTAKRGCLSIARELDVSDLHVEVVDHVDADNLNLLDGATFVFICIDAGAAKHLIVQRLEALGIAFVDVGMGLELVDGSLGGILRVTSSTPDKREHVHDGRISFAEGDENDLYASNIQVADLINGDLP